MVVNAWVQRWLWLTAHAHVYITHIGDSRAYWITRTGCHQVTQTTMSLREVRLGYLSTVMPCNIVWLFGSGAGHEFLGITASLQYSGLSSTNCVFLLCSDGLSDYERVEQCWETEIYTHP